MNALPKLTALVPGASLTSAEKIAFRLGSLLLSAFTVAALLPLVYLVAKVLDLSAPDAVELALVAGTWVGLAGAVLIGILSELWPSPRMYISVTCSCAFALLLWAGWIVYGVSGI
ncbi:hypothetical protein BH09VER1_BH09VER1_43710 [soil metagenome]